MKIAASLMAALAFAGLLLGFAKPAQAQSYSDEFDWFKRVDYAQSTQPIWMTPLVTVTPRLEEEFRYDQLVENQATGSRLNVYDGGKGLELIPTTQNEVIINLPPYEQRTNVKPASGLADDTLLLIKQRIISANAAHGNYIVTGFLSFTAPTGIDAYTAHAWEVTPTIAAGKGWGSFDVQGTCGVTVPTRLESTIGTSVATNVAFQYHIDNVFWPEFEVNDTDWSGGERSGKNQMMLTPGIIFGRFKLGGRFKGNVGFGYQWAVEPGVTKEPALTPTYSNAWITTFRITF